MRIRILIPAISIIALALISIAGRLQNAIQVVPQKPVAPPLEYLGAWGAKGDGPGELLDPISIAADSLGNVYIADSGTGFIHKFAPQGKALLSFQEYGLNHPQSIAVDGGGQIYVSDSVRSSVFIFSPGGDHHRELRLRTRPSAANFLSLVVADDGLIYVFDSDASKAFIFNPRWRLELTWKLPAGGVRSEKRSGPIATGHDGFVYIANSSGHIVKFTRDGHFVAEIAPAANQAKWNPGAGFAVSNNLIYVMDSDGRMLHVITTDGSPKLDWDLAPQLGQASRPAPPLAVSARHELFVLDALERRVLRYHVNF